MPRSSRSRISSSERPARWATSITDNRRRTEASYRRCPETRRAGGSSPTSGNTAFGAALLVFFLGAAGIVLVIDRRHAAADRAERTRRARRVERYRLLAQREFGTGT